MDLNHKTCGWLTKGLLKFCPRMAHKRSTAPLNFAHKRSAALAWHLKFIPGSQKACYVGIANSTLGLLTKQRPATLEWQLLPLNFNIARLTKGLQRWNGSFFF